MRVCPGRGGITGFTLGHRGRKGDPLYGIQTILRAGEENPEIARLGRILRRWRGAFLAHFTTNRTNNGGTEAVNGIIELHRRLARGYRNRYD